MYAIGTLPLIRSLHNPAQWTQVWYADDALVCGCLNDTHEWFSQLCSKGPALGYYPEPLRVICLLMTDIELKLKDCLVLWDFGCSDCCRSSFFGWLFG